MILLSIFAFIVILGLLIFVHELGHFFVAKKAGMKVEEFGFGFPPRLFGIKRGETTYSINFLPLGGFVKITGEDGSESTDPRNFGNKPAVPRFLVLVAGVTMNMIFGWLLISLALGLGMSTVIPEQDQLPKSAKIRDLSVGIWEVKPDSPAFEAGIKPGDNVYTIDGEIVDSIEEAQELTKTKAGNPTKYTIKRGGATLEKTIIPRKDPPVGQGALGVVLVTIGKVSYPAYEAPIRGLVSTYKLTELILTSFGHIIANLFQGQSVGQTLSGPVGIAVLTKNVTELGFVPLIQFAALLSINLGILNAMPFPALDGGRILFLLIEKIRRKKLPIKAEQIANTTGFALLILLMIFVTVSDVNKYSSQFKSLFQRIF